MAEAEWCLLRWFENAAPLITCSLLTSNAHGNGRSTWSDCLRNNAGGMRELARSVERPSEPQANELIYLLWPYY